MTGAVDREAIARRLLNTLSEHVRAPGGEPELTRQGSITAGAGVNGK
jgi:hypothetical protein